MLAWQHGTGAELADAGSLLAGDHHPRGCSLLALPRKRLTQSWPVGGLIHMLPMPAQAANPVRDDRRMGVIRFRAQLQRRGPAAAVVLDEAMWRR